MHRFMTDLFDQKSLASGIAACRAFYGSAIEDLPEIRAAVKIKSPFSISSSDHLCPILNRNILEIVLLFLWCCNFGSNRSNLNLSAK